MAIVRLSNDGFDWPSNCFVCEQSNSHGLRIPFFHDTETNEVHADFRLDDAFSGAPTFLHGGVSLAIADEAMAWVPIAVLRRFAVTVETSTRFKRPVLVDRDHRVVARIAGRDDDMLELEAEILDVDGAVCTTSKASFLALDEEAVIRAAEI